MRKKLGAALVLLCLTAMPVQAAPTAGQNCVGQSISFFGPIGAGLFEILALFGGRGIGEVASTHCDPSWD